MQKSIAMLVLGSVVLWMGCSAGNRAPEWSPDLPDKVSDDTGYIHASATAESTEEQMAIDKAKHEARVRIAQQLDARIQKFLGETENPEEVTNIPERAALEIILRGSRVSNQEIEQDGAVYRAYVLIKMPVQEADRALLERVKADRELYERLQRSESFKRLEKRVEEYKQRK